MIEAALGFAGVVLAAVLAQAEFGGRRELRELTQLTEAASKNTANRDALAAAAAEVLKSFERRRKMRHRMLPALGVLAAVVGLAVLFAVPRGEPSEPGVASAELAVATAAFTLTCLGILLAFGSALFAAWLVPLDTWPPIKEMPKGWMRRLAPSLGIVGLSAVLVWIATAQLFDGAAAWSRLAE